MRTPACDASYNASISSASTRLFIFSTIDPSSCVISRRISASSPGRIVTGATSSLRYSRWRL